MRDVMGAIRTDFAEANQGVFYGMAVFGTILTHAEPGRAVGRARTGRGRARTGEPSRGRGGAAGGQSRPQPHSHSIPYTPGGHLAGSRWAVPETSSTTRCRCRGSAPIRSR